MMLEVDMKKPGIFSLFRHNYIQVLVNAILAIAFTVASFQYVQPKNCYRLCSTESRTACSKGSCNFGDQKAGWPISAFIDAPGGGSPTGGWGLLGPEDPPLPIPILGDVLFYSLLLWLAFCLIQIVQRRVPSYRLVLATLPLNGVLALSLWAFYLMFPYFVPIGRGHTTQVYVNTPTSTTSSPAFSPIVVIPLREIVDTYGPPDYLQLAVKDTTQVSKIPVVLFWNSSDMLVILPEVISHSYVIQENSGIQKIIFCNEKEAIGIDGQLLGETQIPWHGYGDYPQ
jgi:hypothetical protein